MSQTYGRKGQSWHLWCMEHGSYRGPIAWGDDVAETPPCPVCGDETPDTFTKNFKDDTMNECERLSKMYPKDDDIALQKELFRTASSGATRDVNDEKLVYDQFQHPLVVKEFARYMHGKRTMPNGKRPGNNWWKGFPRAWLLESMGRHYMDVWLHVSGLSEYAEESIMTALCGLFFNVQALMLEVILDRHIEEVDE